MTDGAKDEEKEENGAYWDIKADSGAATERRGCRWVGGV